MKRLFNKGFEKKLNLQEQKRRFFLKEKYSIINPFRYHDVIINLFQEKGLKRKIEKITENAFFNIKLYLKNRKVISWLITREALIEKKIGEDNRTFGTLGTEGERQKFRAEGGKKIEGNMTDKSKSAQTIGKFQYSPISAIINREPILAHSRPSSQGNLRPPTSLKQTDSSQKGRSQINIIDGYIKKGYKRRINYLYNKIRNFYNRVPVKSGGRKRSRRWLYSKGRYRTTQSALEINQQNRRFGKEMRQIVNGGRGAGAGPLTTFNLPWSARALTRVIVTPDFAHTNGGKEENGYMENLLYNRTRGSGSNVYLTKLNNNGNKNCWQPRVYKKRITSGLLAAGFAKRRKLKGKRRKFSLSFSRNLRKEKKTRRARGNGWPEATRPTSRKKNGKLLLQSKFSRKLQKEASLKRKLFKYYINIIRNEKTKLSNLIIKKKSFISLFLPRMGRNGFLLGGRKKPRIRGGKVIRRNAISNDPRRIDGELVWRKKTRARTETLRKNPKGRRNISFFNKDFIKKELIKINIKNAKLGVFGGLREDEKKRYTISDIKNRTSEILIPSFSKNFERFIKSYPKERFAKSPRPRRYAKSSGKSNIKERNKIFKSIGFWSPLFKNITSLSQIENNKETFGKRAASSAFAGGNSWATLAIKNDVNKISNIKKALGKEMKRKQFILPKETSSKFHEAPIWQNYLYKQNKLKSIKKVINNLIYRENALSPSQGSDASRNAGAYAGSSQPSPSVPFSQTKKSVGDGKISKRSSDIEQIFYSLCYLQYYLYNENKRRDQKSLFKHQRRLKRKTQLYFLEKKIKKLIKKDRPSASFAKKDRKDQIKGKRLIKEGSPFQLRTFAPFGGLARRGARRELIWLFHESATVGQELLGNYSRFFGGKALGNINTIRDLRSPLLQSARLLMSPSSVRSQVNLQPRLFDYKENIKSIIYRLKEINMGSSLSYETIKENQRKKAEGRDEFSAPIKNLGKKKNAFILEKEYKYFNINEIWIELLKNIFTLEKLVKTTKKRILKGRKKALIENYTKKLSKVAGGQRTQRLNYFNSSIRSWIKFSIERNVNYQRMRLKGKGLDNKKKKTMKKLILDKKINRTLSSFSEKLYSELVGLLESKVITPGTKEKEGVNIPPSVNSLSGKLLSPLTGIVAGVHGTFTNAKTRYPIIGKLSSIGSSSFDEKSELKSLRDITVQTLMKQGKNSIFYIKLEEFYSRGFGKEY